MAYCPNSSTLREHRERLLRIALGHAKAGGLKSVTRERIAEESGLSSGTVSNALGKRDDMMNLVIDAARAEGVTLSY